MHIFQSICLHSMWANSSMCGLYQTWILATILIESNTSISRKSCTIKNPWTPRPPPKLYWKFKLSKIYSTNAICAKRNLQQEKSVIRTSMAILRHTHAQRAKKVSLVTVNLNIIAWAIDVLQKNLLKVQHMNVLNATKPVSLPFDRYASITINTTNPNQQNPPWTSANIATKHSLMSTFWKHTSTKSICKTWNLCAAIVAKRSTAIRIWNGINWSTKMNFHACAKFAANRFERCPVWIYTNAHTLAKNHTAAICVKRHTLTIRIWRDTSDPHTASSIKNSIARNAHKSSMSRNSCESTCKRCTNKWHRAGQERLTIWICLKAERNQIQTISLTMT